MLRRLIRYSCIFALNGCFVLQCFEGGNAVELCNGVMFDFYTGLPHMECLVSVELGEIPCSVSYNISRKSGGPVLRSLCRYPVLTRTEVDSRN